MMTLLKIKQPNVNNYYIFFYLFLIFTPLNVIYDVLQEITGNSEFPSIERVLLMPYIYIYKHTLAQLAE